MVATSRGIFDPRKAVPSAHRKRMTMYVRNAVFFFCSSWGEGKEERGKGNRKTGKRSRAWLRTPTDRRTRTHMRAPPVEKDWVLQAFMVMEEKEKMEEEKMQEEKEEKEEEEEEEEKKSS